MPNSFAEHPITYVLVTAAFNEEAVIEHTLRSVVSQTLLPLRWVIVSDGSTDRTDEIVKKYAAEHDFIQLLRMTDKKHGHNFGAQVRAINAGVDQLKHLQYEFIGNLDADIGLDPEYFQSLFERFRRDLKLGLGGGYICDRQEDGSFLSRKNNSLRSVAHAAQMFRRPCFESTGAYQPLPYGGPDTHAEVSARMNGWAVRSFPELRVLHYRPTGTANGIFRNSFRQGLMDYSLGYDPLYEVAKVMARMSAQPVSLMQALTTLSAYAWSSVSRKERPVSKEFVSFLRREQRERLGHAFMRTGRSTESAPPAVAGVDNQ
jgi:poly-beta-1,6-N-acetyl-D-glucosamine synthase